MPRSVQLANVAAIALGLSSIIATALWAVARLGGAIDARNAGSGGFFTLFAVALAFPSRARQREARVRELAFQAALLAAMLLGFLVLATLVSLVAGGVSARDLFVLVDFVLLVAFTWALSRPGAKAWFDAGRGA